MAQSKRRSSSMHILFTIALFTAFAASVLMVLLLGAQAYTDISAKSGDGYDARLCLSYVAAKVRHYDTENTISIARFGGADALVMEEEIDGYTYQTIIYYHEGYVKEIFFEKDFQMMPGDGTSLVAASGLGFSSAEDGHLLISYIGENGKVSDLHLDLRSKGGGEM